MNSLSRIDPDDPYPQSDGEPMAENTLQYDWIVKLKENLELRFADRPDVFVAGDLFWYPVADRRITGPLAPDVLVAFGRPKGPRGCYKQWEEGGIAPQVVFEVFSPSNSAKELRDKRDFYETYGVEEYYLYDPERNRLEIWLRQGERLQPVSHLNGWVSPRLDIRFALGRERLEVFHPDGSPFRSPLEMALLAQEERQRAEQADRRATQSDLRAEQEYQRAETLAARLRALGLDPDA
jgi:Uma2 family endonuclease